MNWSAEIIFPLCLSVFGMIRQGTALNLPTSRGFPGFGIMETGHPDQIADVIKFLLSSNSSFVHGQVIYVDGGTEAIMRPDLV